MELNAKADPFFSIVIPAYNREFEILRAINSCLTQSYKDFEVVVVDDASTDNTAEVVAGINDSRVKLIRHEVNRNVCPTRNTGVENSRGEWIVFLDSDDILLPGALEKMWNAATNCPVEVSQLGFLFGREDGRVSPEPMPQDCLLDYSGFMELSDGLILTDWVQCTRRSTFEIVKFPDSRAYESPYLLDFAQKYTIRLIPETTGFKFLDSANRLTTSSWTEAADKISRTAPEHLAATDYLLTRHGKALRKHSPRRFHVYRKMQLLYCFLAGERWRGLQLAFSYMISFPGDIAGWAICAGGLIGPRALARVRMMKPKKEKPAPQVITPI